MTPAESPLSARRLLRRIPKPGAVLKNHLLYRWLLPLRKRPLSPRALCLLVTERCNMRCRACGIWTEPPGGRAAELSPEEWDRLLADPLFRKTEFVNLNGGEPNLRSDLAEIAASVVGRFPRLHTITLNTNGLPPERTAANADRISRLAASRRIKFSVAVSLHGLGPLFDDMSGVPGAFEKVSAALRALRGPRDEGRLYLSVNCVVTNLNAARLDDLVAWGEAERIPVNFTLGEVRERFRNSGMAGDILIRPEDRPRLAAFFRGLAGRTSSVWHHALRYNELANMLENDADRRLACHYALGGAIISPEGRLFYCKRSRDIGDARAGAARSVFYDPGNLAYRSGPLLRETCPRCPPNTFIKMEAERDLLRLLSFAVRKR